MLFTSGSEKAPKAVPLTHANILTNQRSGLAVLGLTRQDSVLGFLPAFHSFGLTMTGLLPLVAGLRVVHHPDPTDAGGLVRKIAAYKPTLLVGTPTFLGYILDRAKPGDLESLRLILVGAEKCPDGAVRPQLPSWRRTPPCWRATASPNARRWSRRIGPARFAAARSVRPLPDVSLRVHDLDTDEPVRSEPARHACSLADRRFSPATSATTGRRRFEEIAGKRWYVTGDLAKLDDDGFVHFDGRLKRFLKAGGEMISLPALEEPFAKMYPPTQDGPRVAVEGIETEGGRRIVLFTTEPLTLRDANAKLLEEGFRGVMRFDEVRSVDKIPLLGTGKTDYKVLRAQIQK